jgi:hypothetical protein
MPRKHSWALVLRRRGAPHAHCEMLQTDTVLSDLPAWQKALTYRSSLITNFPLRSRRYFDQVYEFGGLEVLQRVVVGWCFGPRCYQRAQGALQRSVRKTGLQPWALVRSTTTPTNRRGGVDRHVLYIHRKVSRVVRRQSKLYQNLRGEYFLHALVSLFDF